MAQPLTPEDFHAFGTVVQAPSGSGRLINEGSSERFDLLDDMQLAAEGGRPLLAIFRAQARHFPHQVIELERHALGSQTFLPLGALRFVIVVAPASQPGATDTELPQPQNLKAFVTDGRQGVVLAPGTWHHALLAVDAGDFVVMERGAPTVDCQTAALNLAVTVLLP